MKDKYWQIIFRIIEIVFSITIMAFMIVEAGKL